MGKVSYEVAALKGRKTIFTTYRSEFLYLLFGGLTTVVNYVVFWGVDRLFQHRLVLLTNLIAFLAAALFAFLVNKQYVFRSRAWDARSVAREGASFLLARVFSFFLEEAGLYVSDRVLHLGEYQFGPINGVMLAKIALSIVVVVLNYFFSKFFVFSNGGGQDEKQQE